ncbi:pilus assembly protein CpaF [Agromyces flavus]|uniref:Pilus assembly protein CpaF n=1 Tax=Agromyces flavus TaxID=589382 RepID=A0A1H1XSR6_9MICO|nr:CpaF family protein [Agromyces flavus]MCP2366493.1 pilus assembly protein CpaF [Agromyces flavus]GGI44786.1 type II secretion system protein E [Agromyces flavus]SDT11909.1 pilus assembly protein CpaF [Agromyces flavus]
MGLNDRLNALRSPQVVVDPTGLRTYASEDTQSPDDTFTEVLPEVADASVEEPTPALFKPPASLPTAMRPVPILDPLAPIKEKAAQELFVRIGSRMSDASLTEEQLHALAKAELADIVAAEQIALTTAERNRLIDDIGADVLGYGPLESLLEDPTVSEIMVNRFDQLYVERQGRLMETPHRFTGEPQLRRVIERIVSRVGRRIDESSPLVDARLEDGSRVNAIIPPLAVNGSSLTIRKFAGTPYTVEDLVQFGTLTREVATVLDAAVRAKLNILVSGGTGTGKTTLLNVLSAFIPTDERIITIEDAVELQLQQEHVVRLESRPPNIEGRGEITIRDLVRNSLRMRPDRIVVGEVRGAESLDMLQAMNTGHEGSISTLHANSPRDAISRMETLVLMAGMDLPLRAIREQISSAIDLIVQITRHKDGVRRVTQVTEVHGMEGDIITLQDAFSFDYSAGYDEEGKLKGRIEPTGVRPRFAERIADHGIKLPVSLFQRDFRGMLGEIR